MAGAGHDHMVQDPDPQDLAALDESLCNLQVFSIERSTDPLG